MVSGADNQTLSLSGDDLTIADGNTIDVSSVDNQTLSLSGNNLTIADGNSVNLNSVDNQTLSFVGTTITINNGNSINVSSLSDNLGNHNATQDIILDGFDLILGGNTEIGIVSGSTGIDNDIIPHISTTFDVGNNLPNEHWDQMVANEFVTFSDRRLKHQIEPLSYGLSELMQINTYRYEYTYDKPGKKRLGVMANDIVELIPEMVITEDVDQDEEGNWIVRESSHMAVAYDGLIPVLVNATKEQQHLLDQLQSRIEKQDQVIEDLIRLINTMQSE